MTPSTISTWPVLKLRWKLVASSCASQRQNSMLEKARASPAFAAVGHREFPDFQRLAERHEISGLRLDLVVARTDGGVAHAVAAFVFVELGARRLPGRRPELAGVVVADVEIAPADIERRVVVAVAGQAAQARVAVKGIAAGGVRDDAEIRFAAEVIDPRQRRVGLGDDVFAFWSSKCP
jgi:hypothetical protein